MSEQTILRLPCVIKRTGLPRSTIYAYVDQKRFPAPIKIGTRNVGWIESEINAWIESCIQSSQPKHDKK